VPKKTRREYPLLVSDLVRSYLALIAFIPGIIGFTFIAVRVVDRDFDRTAFLFFSMFSGWVLLCGVYLVLTLVAFNRAGSASLRSWLRATTPMGRWQRIWWGANGGGGTYWALTGSGLAIIAIIIVAVTPDVRTEPITIGSGVAVVVSSLAIIVVSFAVRYAREDAVAGGLEFPGTTAPRFSDYVYLAVQVSTTFGGSDVSITKPGMRRLVSVHSLVSFGFNTVIVALMVSVFVTTVTAG